MKRGKEEAEEVEEERKVGGQKLACVICLLLLSKSLFLFLFLFFSLPLKKKEKRKKNPPHSCSWSHSELDATLQVSDPPSPQTPAL